MTTEKDPIKKCPYQNTGTKPPEHSPQPHRRGFLHFCIGIMTVISAFTVAFPIFSFCVKLPKKLGGSKRIEVALDELSEDQALYFNREGIQIVLVYTNKEPKVFDAACTHLGCLVAWDQNSHIFRCPCHGAAFSDRGEVVSGPVNAPLKEIKFEIKEKKIIIT